MSCRSANSCVELGKALRALGFNIRDTQLAPLLGRALEGNASLGEVIRRLRSYLAGKGINLTAEQEATVFREALLGTKYEGKDLTPHLRKPPAPPRQIPEGVDPAAGWTWERWEEEHPNVGTKDNPVRIYTDKNGKEVRIYGKLDSSSKTPGHAEAMRNQAIRLAQSGEYSEIHFQHGWGTASGEKGATNKLFPDIIGVKRNGKVDAWEVWSDTDIKNKVDLDGRLDKGRKTLPEERQGDIFVIDPEPPPK
jgi:hypothetical protein